MIGAINLTDAAKLKTGRVPTPAMRVRFDQERNYDFDQFEKAAAIQETFGGTGTTQKVEVPAEVAQLVTIDELDQRAVRDRVSPVSHQRRLAERRMPSPTTQRALPMGNPRETTTAEPLRTVTRTA